MYLYEAIVATTILRIREVGLIVSGANDNKAIIARYPDDPACPTDEYRIAIKRKRKAAKKIVSVVMYKATRKNSLIYVMFLILHNGLI